MSLLALKSAKSNTSTFLAGLVCVLVLIGNSTSRGQTWNWNRVVNENWADAGNWTGATGFPDTAGGIANITNDIPNGRTVTVNSPVTVGIINIGDPDGSSPYTITGTAANTLTLDNGLAASQINFLSTSLGADTVSAPLRLTGNLNIDNTSTAEKRIGGATHSAVSAGNKIITNVSTGTGLLAFTSGAIFTDGGGGTISMVQNSATSIISFGNTSNTYSGGFTLQQGRVRLTAGTNTVFGSGTLSLVSGEVEQIGAGSRGIANAVSITGDISFIVENTIQFSGATNLNGATRDLNIASGLVSYLNGGTITNGGISKSGVGTLSFIGAKAYTGPTLINAGTLVLATTGNIASTVLGFSVFDASSGVLEIQNASYTFAGALEFTLAAVTVSNKTWNLFTGSAFGPTDLSISGITSDLGAFAFSGGTWNLTESGRNWSFDAALGELELTTVPIPEPSSWALLAVGLCAVTLIRRRSVNGGR